MSKDQEIRDLFAKHGVTLMLDDVWAVQGKPVVRHKAVERLGAAIKVQWAMPQIIRSERDEVVLLVSGHIGTGLEWSFGEARVQEMISTGRKNDRGKPIYEPQGIGNYAVSPRQAAYPYAMAEKRGKDRVILKLAGLHGVYSEEEADDFKERAPEPSNEPQRHERGEYIEGPPRKPDPMEGYHPPSKPAESLSKKVYIDLALKRMDDFDSAAELLRWAKEERARVWPQYQIDAHDPDGQRLVYAYKERMAVLEELE